MRMLRSVLFCLLVVALLPTAVTAGAKSGRPNIIVIMCDDLGYEGFSCYGSLTYKTPHLDKLAAEGMRFNHCYSQPICTPSRVKIMTGQGNWRNYERFGLLPKGSKTFGNVLEDAGYDTVIAGKWQLSGDAEKVKRIGFGRHILWQLEGRGSRYWDPILVQDGKKLTGLEKRFGPEVVTDYLVDFIAEPREKPFFIYHPMCLPHWPFVPTPDSPEGGSRQRLGKYDGQPGGTEYFDDMVAYLDKMTGRIVAQLEKTGQRENTLILFTCDNGTATNIVSEMPFGKVKGGKGSTRDNGNHVALIANWPGKIKAGSVTDALVEFSDFVPTVAEAAGVAIPDSMTIDGVSFLNVLLDKEGPRRDSIIVHYLRNGYPSKPKGEEKVRQAMKKQASAMASKQAGRFVRDQRYKLYMDGELYDIQEDVAEAEPIALGKGSEEAEAARQKLQKVHDSLPPWKYFRSGNGKTK